MKKNVIKFSILGMVLLLAILVFAFQGVDAQETGVCCERLKGENDNGAWCQNVADESECATGINPSTGESYKSLATSCEQSSFCTPGTCVNQRQGTCTEGVPQQICTTEDGGYWVNDFKENIPECQIGCCLYGGTASLVTATQCTYESSLAGIEAEYDPTITSEFECISNVLDEEEGACIYQTDVGTRTCDRLSKSECDDLSSSNIVEGSKRFEVGKLCSAPELGTICGPTTNTIIDGYDVYYVDSCGNKANIYDSERNSDKSDTTYWSRIEEGAECDDELGNKNSKTCGECTYSLGSKAKSYRDVGTSKPINGDYICASLDCDLNNNGIIETGKGEAKHSETWCASSSDLSDINVVGQEYVSTGDKSKENLPGSRYVQLECRNGEIIETACDPFRNTICAESYYDLNENGEQDETDFRVGQCVANRWDDCAIQTEKESCEDQNARDCQWLIGSSRLTEDGNFFAFDDETGKPASCVPKYAPGFDFWSETSDSVDACSLSSTQCVVQYEVSWIRNREKVLAEAEIEERIGYCTDNCYCIPGYEEGMAKNKYENNKPAWHPKSYDDWMQTQSLSCISLGDCGIKSNYAGIPGEERDDILDTGNFIKKPK